MLNSIGSSGNLWSPRTRFQRPRSRSTASGRSAPRRRARHRSSQDGRQPLVSRLPSNLRSGGHASVVTTSHSLACCILRGRALLASVHRRSARKPLSRYGRASADVSAVIPTVHHTIDADRVRAGIVRWFRHEFITQRRRTTKLKLSTADSLPSAEAPRIIHLRRRHARCSSPSVVRRGNGCAASALVCGRSATYLVCRWTDAEHIEVPDVELLVTPEHQDAQQDGTTFRQQDTRTKGER